MVILRFEKRSPHHVDARLFYQFYECHKRWGETWMINKEDLGSHSGGRRLSFSFLLDVPWWCSHCGITRKEYEHLDRAIRQFHTDGSRWTQSEELIERILT